jgi:hypothetical protein
MDQTLNQIKKELQQIADEHRQINEFFFGDFLDAVTRDYVDYVLMVATIQPGLIGDRFVDVNLNIVICDKYNEGEFRNIDEVHSDCLSICHDIYVTFKQTHLEQYIDINGDVSTTPFINRGQDVTAGWSMDMSLRVYSDENQCAIPYDNYDFEN